MLKDRARHQGRGEDTQEYVGERSSHSLTGARARGWTSLRSLGSYIQAVGVMRAGEVGLHGHGVWLMLHKCQGSPSPGEKRLELGRGLTANGKG